MTIRKVVRRTTQQAPSGYILGRRSPGRGPVELLKLTDLVAMGVASGQQASAGSAAHGFGFSITGRPGAAQVIGIAVFPAQMTFVDADPRDVVTAAVPANASAVFSMQVQIAGIWTQVGTITFSAAGTTGAVLWGGTYVLAANTQLRLVAPNPQDPSLADISGKIVGTQG